MVWAIPENNITNCYPLNNVSVIKTHTVCPIFRVYVYVGLIIRVHNRGMNI